MRLLLGLGLHQGRCLGVVGLCGLVVLLVIGTAAQLASGLQPAMVLAPASLLSLMAVLLPEFLQIVLPLSLAHGLLTLYEGGELAAVRAVGVHPLLVSSAIVVPLLPLCLLLHWVVHETRPAALLEARRTAVASPQAFLTGLESLGVGLVGDGERLNIMLPVGKRVVAVSASGMRRTAQSIEVQRGVLHVVGRTTQVADSSSTAGFTRTVGSAEFERLHLGLTKPEVGLSMLGVAALSTRFLETQSIRWRRSKLRWSGEPSAVRIRRELGRRDWTVASVSLSLLIVLLLLGYRRVLTPVYVHAVGSSLAVSVSLFLPRLLSSVGSAT